MKPENKQLFSHLHSIRTRQKLTMRELENLSGVPISRICDYENGVEPKLSAARKLARALGVSVDELFTPDGEIGFTIDKVHEAIADLKRCEARAAECQAQFDATKTAFETAKEEHFDAQSNLRLAERELNKRQQAVLAKPCKQPVPFIPSQTMIEPVREPEVFTCADHLAQSVKATPSETPTIVGSGEVLSTLEEYRLECVRNNVDPSVLAAELAPPKPEIVHNEVSREERLAGKRQRMSELVKELKAKAAASGR